ncbi:ABC-type oligopeptide transport system substrate-binding subunit [Paraburkholderia sp. RAU6.4a]
MPTTVRLPDVQVPGTEQLSRFGSKYADEPGSDNLAGVKSPAVDAILRKVLGAQTREQLVDATHALDRVLMNGYYVIPHWYSAVHRIAYGTTSSIRRSCRFTSPPTNGYCRHGGRRRLD